MAPYIWSGIFDELCRGINLRLEPVFKEIFFYAALSPESIHYRDARDLISWAHVSVNNMRKCSQEMVCVLLMGSSFSPPHRSLLSKAIVHPYFIDGQKYNMACSLGLIISKSKDLHVFVEPEALTLEQYERALEGYLKAVNDAKSIKDISSV